MKSETRVPETTGAEANAPGAPRSPGSPGSGGPERPAPATQAGSAPAGRRGRQARAVPACREQGLLSALVGVKVALPRGNVLTRMPFLLSSGSLPLKWHQKCNLSIVCNLIAIFPFYHGGTIQFHQDFL